MYLLPSAQSQYFKVVFDIDPIQKGHLLLISKDHYTSLTQLPKEMRYDLIDLQAALVAKLEQHLPISGVTSVSNDKELMDEGTHFHLHLIPRLTNDSFWEGITINQENWDLAPFLKHL
ncbi:TPA: HIT family protein [Streptococcus pyogenes]|nr:HIT domain-containing protein [Streptococcus pyogenes]HEQ3640486.1 HIT family protein [Streptococcus pyogenes]HEQ3643741.1 HIT family protein [Streptococcus pyogenes]HEQ3659952.1 HIT family protein [Streptococcus pyogenes]HEQ3666486.1 HIT family protein [Streptococcus pyogenes]